MPAWNETHYARAQEFARRLAEALLAAQPGSDAPAPPARDLAVPPPAAAPTPPAGPTAANVFKKIPWKK